LRGPRKENHQLCRKATKLTAIIIENQNTAAAARSAHFPKMREVVEVVLLL
jgi:hypothetical protein